MAKSADQSPEVKREGAKKGKKKQPVLMTFKQRRYLEKQAEWSNLGPGSTDTFTKTWGQDVKPSKYGLGGCTPRNSVKVSFTAGPGHYELDAAYDAIKKSSISKVTIKPPVSREVESRPKEETPAPGTYAVEPKFGDHSPRKRFII